ncbi:MAG: hypothetical protein IK086_03110 [Clostridia bacterium]|nr:hypothetical protein [Clostridia bacterium]
MRRTAHHRGFSIGKRFKSRRISFLRPIELFGKFLYDNLSKVIKFIAYAVAIATLIIGFIVAYFVYRHVDSFIAISFAVVLATAILAFIEFFLIYGLGHMIEQNNEILKRLGK